LLVDVDEDELAFSPRPNDAGRIERELIEEPFAAVHSRLAIENLDAADAMTVSNPVLLSRFPGHVVRHARDEHAPRVDRAAARRRFGFTSDDFVIAFIGTARPHKGLSHVIAALQAIDDPRLKLLVAGSVSREVERELADPRLRGRIVKHPPFAISEIGVFLAAADLVPILQDPDSLIARTQLPAKLIDALWYGLATVATDVEPIGDIAACGVVDVIAGADFAGYVKAMRAGPPQPQLPDHRKRVFAGEFGLGVNRARLAAAIREATTRHDPPRSRVRARLANLLAETRAAAAAVGEAELPSTPKQSGSSVQFPDLAFFWKQNDSRLFGRRSNHVVEQLLKSGRINRIIHFDHSVSLGDLRHMVGEDFEPPRGFGRD
jgi:glycosyltransferase involved in cell wall biosynthesis